MSQGPGAGGVGKLQAVYPVLVGGPRPAGEKGYPFSGNFFSDGSNDAVRRLPDLVCVRVWVCARACVRIILLSCVCLE